MLKKTSKSRNSSPTRSVSSTPRTPLERNLSYGFPNQPHSSNNSSNNSRRNSISSTGSNPNYDQPNLSQSRRISITPSVNGNPTLRIQIFNLFDLRFSYASIFQSISIVISLWSLSQKGFTLMATLVGLLSSSTFNVRARAEHLGLRKVSLLVCFLLFLSITLHSMLLGDDSRYDLSVRKDNHAPHALEARVHLDNLSLRQKVMRRINRKINRGKSFERRSTQVRGSGARATKNGENLEHINQDKEKENENQAGKKWTLDFDLAVDGEQLQSTHRISSRNHSKGKQVTLTIVPDLKAERSEVEVWHQDQLDRRKIENALRNLLFPSSTAVSAIEDSENSNETSSRASDPQRTNRDDQISTSRLLCEALSSGSEVNKRRRPDPSLLYFRGYAEIKIRYDRERIFVLCGDENEDEEESSAVWK